MVSSTAPTRNKQSWLPRGAESNPCKGPCTARLGTWGTMESNQRNWHQHVSPFLELILKGVLEKSNPCNKGCSLGLWKHGFRHLLSQTVCDYQQITWPRCSDPRESLNTFVDVGTGVSVLLFPFHSREKIVLPCLIGWRRQMHSGAPSAI